MRKYLNFTLMFLCLFLFSGQVCANEALDQQFEGFDLEGFSDSGEKAWDIKGETADMQPNQIKLSNVNANSYGDEGESGVNVTADYGTIDQVNGNMLLEDDVIITSNSGVQMLTETLSWSRMEDLIETDDDVIITDDAMTMTGRGLRAHPGLKSAEIQDDVMVRIDTELDNPDNKLVTITSEGSMVMDQINHIATFKDDVVAVYEDRTLKSNRMDIFFNDDMSDISNLVCTGNVIIEQGENRTYAEKADYNHITQKLILSGRPKLIFLTEGKNAITSFGN